MNIFGTSNAETFADTNVTNVEEIYVRFDGASAGDAGIDVSDNDDVEQVWVTKGNANGNAVELTKAQTAGIEGTVDGALTFSFDKVSGTADEATLALSDADIGDYIDGEGADEPVTIAGIETLNIVAGGEKNSIDGFIIGETETLNITGDGDFSFNTAEALVDVTDGDASAIETVSAGDATGDLRIDLSSVDAPNDLDVTTGSGDDLVLAQFGNLSIDSSDNAEDSFDLGDGDDILMFADDVTITTAAEAAVLGGVTNVETLAVQEFLDDSAEKSATAPTVNIDMDLIEQDELGLSTAELIELDNVTSSDSIGFYQATNGEANTIAMKQGEQTLNLELMADEDDEAVLQDTTVTGASTVNVESTIDDDEQNTAANVLGLTTAPNGTINVTGDQDLNLTATAGGVGATETGLTIDASELAADLTVTGSLGTDVITVGSGKENTINATTGADAYTLGDGEDTVVYASEVGTDPTQSGNADGTGIDTITGFDAANDTIDVSGIDDGTDGLLQSFVSDAIDVSGADTIDAALDTAVDELALIEVGFFEFEGSTYVVGDTADEATEAFVDADLAIELVGTDLGLAAENFVLGADA
ncbi:hypothetical protein BB931_03145 [Spiribacter salinus]|nr:hypothetical protein [Spiribacter salinus]